MPTRIWLANRRIRLHRLDKGVVPGDAHQRLTAAPGEDLLADAEVDPAGRHVAERVHPHLQPLDEARVVDLRGHGLEIEPEAAGHVGVLGVGGDAGDEVGEGHVVALDDLGRAVLKLAVAVPVPTAEEGGDLGVLLPGRRHRQIAAVLGLELGLVIRVLEGRQDVLEVVPVAVEGVLQALAVPAGDALVGRRDVLHLVGIEVFLRNGCQVRRPVADPVGAAVDDVIDVLAGLEGDHHLLVELAEGGVHHVYRAAGQLLELLGMQRHRLAHHGHGVGQDGDLVPGVVLRVGRLVRANARDGLA